MADIATRITGPSLVTSTAVTRYTVAASKILIVRHIRVINPTASAVTFTLSIGAIASGTCLWDAFVIPPGDGLDWSGFLVLAAAEIIQVKAGTTNVMTLTISGVVVDA